MNADADDVAATLGELLARGDIVRSWDPVRGWLYQLTKQGADRAVRALPAAQPALRALLEMAVEMSKLYAHASSLLWDLATDDIDIVKQLRVMFSTSKAPTLAEAALVLLNTGASC